MQQSQTAKADLAEGKTSAEDLAQQCHVAEAVGVKEKTPAETSVLDSSLRRRHNSQCAGQHTSSAGRVAEGDLQNPGPLGCDGDPGWPAVEMAGQNIVFAARDEGEFAGQNPRGRRDRGDEGREPAHHLGLEPVRPPQQTALLQFADENLEAKYGIYINKMFEGQDRFWTMMFVFIACVTVMYQRSSRYTYWDWLPFFSIRFLAHGLSHFFPRFWLRHREVIWVVERFHTYGALSLPNTSTILNPNNHRFAFGNWLMISSAFVGKVRFHVQLMVTIMIIPATHAFLMAYKKRGIFTASMTFIFWQHASCIAPCVWMYYWDRMLRTTFMQKFRARQLDWMIQLLQLQ